MLNTHEDLVEEYRIRYWEINELQTVQTMASLQVACQEQLKQDSIVRELGYVPEA